MSKNILPKIGLNLGGAVGLILLFVFPVWRFGSIATVLYVFFCCGVGCAIGTALQALIGKQE